MATCWLVEIHLKCCIVKILAINSLIIFDIPCKTFNFKYYIVQKQKAGMQHQLWISNDSGYTD